MSDVEVRFVDIAGQSPYLIYNDPIAGWNQVHERVWPALLRALIAQAGGVEVEVDNNEVFHVQHGKVNRNMHMKSGRYLLLPMEGSE